ncbi:hypothetical protein CN198_14085 [Sinorhizobium meliloti]|uniref:hypothetical protein n=1 Tax=Rhizobium meliloti TaxID=382 RepID=UPI000FD7B63A|nr:hypothetical protein [Sinorhizobium meliloti]RVH69191.1 hypothetical protein CN198_14085 [Sinorhizobium meliloti]
MSFFRNFVVQGCSWIAFIGCGLWTYHEPGFEPAIGLILAAVGIASNCVPISGKKGRVLTPERKIELRDKWRPIFKDYFLQAARENTELMSSSTTRVT